MRDTDKGIAEAFADQVWPAHTDAPLKQIRILHRDGDSDVLGCISRAKGAYTILAAGNRSPREFVTTLFHELGHAMYGRMGSGESSHNLGLDALADAIRGDPDAVELHKAVRNPDVDEEQWCDDWAESKAILYADRLLSAANGDGAPLAAMLRMDLGSPTASMTKARGGTSGGTRTARLAGVIKAVVDAGGQWTLDVLGAPFGSILDKDADGEWFDAETDFRLEEFPTAPVVYYHGWTPEGKPRGSPAYIGRVVRRWIDQAGMWFRVVLDQAKQEARRVWEAAQRDAARASTGTLPHLARVDRSGHILEWPIGELSLLDAEGGRQPVNRHAVAIPVMKALYDQAGMELPATAYPPNPGCVREAQRRAGLRRCRALLRQIRAMDN